MPSFSPANDSLTGRGKITRLQFAHFCARRMAAFVYTIELLERVVIFPISKPRGWLSAMMAFDLRDLCLA